MCTMYHALHISKFLKGLISRNWTFASPISRCQKPWSFMHHNSHSIPSELLMKLPMDLPMDLLMGLQRKRNKICTIWNIAAEGYFRVGSCFIFNLQLIRCLPFISIVQHLFLLFCMLSPNIHQETFITQFTQQPLTSQKRQHLYLNHNGCAVGFVLDVYSICNAWKVSCHQRTILGVPPTKENVQHLNYKSGIVPSSG